jgi:aryl-alcohol dehydrogenase-like predicted oxidoreductase
MKSGFSFGLDQISPPRMPPDYSRLMLGTVQFGMSYGIANRLGQPSYHQILEILSAAIEGGINCLDTAAAYGTSEEQLGKALKELRANDRMHIVTKVMPLSEDLRRDPKTARLAIEQSVDQSRQRLQLDTIPVVLFHCEQDAAFLDVLADLQAKGWLSSFGVSCDNRPGNTRSFLQRGATALQIPASILDRRHQHSGILEQASATNAAIFVRSVYLQGLLTMSAQDVPQSLQAVIPIRTRFALLGAEYGLTLNQLALRYILSLPGVTSAITGVESCEQIRDNLQTAAAGPLPQELLKQMLDDQPNLPEAVVTPSQWTPR